MVLFNHATRQMTAKIVYYGPGLCGKTTNLSTIYCMTSQKARGEMVSLNTETDRTLFFDLLPMDVGVVSGFKTRLQLYTVPGQVFYNSTRKLVLKGVDGIVFVVDSQIPMLEASRESLQNLEENLRELGMEIGDIPMVFQWNKRDLKNVVPVPLLEAELNPKGLPSFESVAQDGTGVFETLRGISRVALAHIKTQHLGELSASREPSRAEPPPAAEPGPPPPQALSLSDLPSMTEMMEEDADLVEAPDFPEPPEFPDPLPDEDRDERPLPPTDQPVPGPPPQVADALPEAASPAAEAPPPQPPPMRTQPVLPRFTFRPQAPPPKAGAGKSDPQAAINSLLGELTQVGRLGAPSVVKVDLPEDCGAEDIEVVVQIRQGDQVLAEGRVKRPVPSKGIAAKLSLELKRP